MFFILIERWQISVSNNQDISRVNEKYQEDDDGAKEEWFSVVFAQFLQPGLMRLDQLLDLDQLKRNRSLLGWFCCTFSQNFQFPLEAF